MLINFPVKQNNKNQLLNDNNKVGEGGSVILKSDLDLNHKSFGPKNKPCKLLSIEQFHYKFTPGACLLIIKCNIIIQFLTTTLQVRSIVAQTSPSWAKKK